TGRAALAALVGALLILAVRAPATIVAVNALIGAGIGADLLLAAALRPLRLERSGDTSALLGDGAQVTLTVINPGRRRLRADVRDAWQPSAGAWPHHSRVSIPPGGRVRVTTTLRPDRRGDKTAAAV